MEQRDYVRRLLDVYRLTPGTCGVVRRPDRVMAAQLHQRSLAYFSPVIEEVLQLQVSQEYFQHLRHKLQRAASAR
jgi:hypothetical protein